MPGRAALPAFLMCLLAASTAASVARADIYRYVDGDGVVHFTNVPGDSRYTLFLKAVKKSPSRYIQDYEDIINRAAGSFGVESSLIKAVIKAESDFDHEAVSVKGAQGLMQLMPLTARVLQVEDPFDPEANIIGGTRYLSHLLQRFGGDVRLALAAYNAGPERVETYRDVPPFEETRTFVDRVLRYAGLYDTGR